MKKSNVSVSVEPKFTVMSLLAVLAALSFAAAALIHVNVNVDVNEQ